MKIPINFKKILIINIIIFVLTIFITFFLNFKSDSISDFILANSEKYSKNVDFLIIIRILFNNILASIIIIISGIMIVVPLAIFMININLYIIQFLVILKLGIPLKIILILGVLHVVFEFTAMIISTSIAIYIPYSLFNYIVLSKDLYLDKENLRCVFKMFLFSIFLLIIASVVEGSVIYIVSKSYI